MGLLTDPTAGQGKLTKALLSWHVYVTVALYAGGVAWFCALAYPTLNADTYFSENALLPGLVQNEFREEQYAKLYHTELLDEMEKYRDSVPYPWLRAKFRQLGLDVYVHNFTLSYPLGEEKVNFGRDLFQSGPIVRLCKKLENKNLFHGTTSTERQGKYDVWFGSGENR